MSLLIEHDREIERLHRGTRRFLLSGLALVVLIVGGILVRQGLFRQTATLHFVAESAQDLVKGQAVKVAGFKVGVVDQVALRADGKVAAELSIQADFMRFVTHDAILELHKEGLVGSAVIEIIPGPDREQLASDGAELPFRRNDGLTTLANNLRDQILPILADVKSMTAVLADQQRGLPAILDQVRSTTAALEAVLKTSNQQMAQLGPQAQDSVKQLNRTLGEVNSRLPPMLQQVQDILGHVGTITGSAQTTVPPILQDGKAAASDVHDILTGVKTAWPVRDLVPAVNLQALPSDSDMFGGAGRER